MLDYSGLGSKEMNEWSPPTVFSSAMASLSLSSLVALETL